MCGSRGHTRTCSRRSFFCLAQLVHGYATVEQLTEEHNELVRTIEAGRPAAAEAAIRDHLERATAWLMERVATAGA
jgi:DNA-binding FadR family transcriptional regulator